MGVLEPYAAVAGAAGSGVFQARGARASGRAIQAASDINAQNTLYETGQQAARIRKGGSQEIGRERAVLGTSGLQVAGSPLERLTQNAAEIERQAMEATLAGQYSAGIDVNRGKIARKEASRISAASLFEGGTKAAYYGRSLL